jgi:hypothetical protein
MEKKAMYESDKVNIKYNITTDHLIDLDKNDFIKWARTNTKKSESLDQLYYLKEIFTVTT